MSFLPDGFPATSHLKVMPNLTRPSFFAPSMILSRPCAPRDGGNNKNEPKIKAADRPFFFISSPLRRSFHKPLIFLNAQNPLETLLDERDSRDRDTQFMGQFQGWAEAFIEEVREPACFLRSEAFHLAVL